MIDFGCGRGNYAFGAAAAVGAEGIVYALDTDSDVLSFLKSEAEQRGVSNLYPMPSHEDASMDFPDASADAILIYDLIHVQALRARFLAESRRVLKPGGILFVGATEAILNFRKLGYTSFQPFFYQRPLA